MRIQILFLEISFKIFHKKIFQKNHQKVPQLNFRKKRPKVPPPPFLFQKFQPLFSKMKLQRGARRVRGGARLLHLPGAVDLGGAPPRSRICQPLCSEAFKHSFIPTAATTNTCSTNYGSNNHNHASCLPVCSAPCPSQHNCPPLTG